MTDSILGLGGQRSARTIKMSVTASEPCPSCRRNRVRHQFGILSVIGRRTHYRRSAFCDIYRRWTKRLKRSMRQRHLAGEKLFVGYAGRTVPI